MASKPLTVVGLGEALFDVFPDRRVLGGAPLNVAVHAHQLLKAVGGRGVVASRVGNDELGKQLIAELSRRGMTANYVQTDEERPTGQVFVTFDGARHSFEIAKDSAWDALQVESSMAELAADCDAVCFGTLGQRSATARAAIGEFLNSAGAAVRLFDVNLRQHYFDAEVIRESCQAATAVKLNDEELPVVARLLGLEEAAETPDEAITLQADRLRRAFDLEFVALTRGEHGTVLFTESGRFEAEPVRYPTDRNADSVGAGDACAAGLLVGRLLGWPAERQIWLANRAGAFVASVAGATPDLPDEVLEMVARG
jgi:fructokinase